MGRWAQCAPGSDPFGTGEAGLEFTIDGRFFTLYADVEGHFVRGAGFDREGTYIVMDYGNGPQLDITVAGSGTGNMLPSFGSNPPTLRFHDVGEYVRVE